MNAHTPGPWFTSRPHGTIYIEARLRGSTLQEVAAVGPTEASAQQEANAQLITASPDLLEACQTFHKWLTHEETGVHSLGYDRSTAEGEAAWRKWFYGGLELCSLAQEQARAAIAKATASNP